MSLAPGTAQIGDIISVFLGCPTPMIVRPTNDEKSHYLLVGSCYIHGVMDSEAH
jgi:hypothetical protein